MRTTIRVFTYAIAVAFMVVAIHAQAQTVSLAVIQKYAPSIYLNAYDNNHPSSVDTFFAQSILIDSNGNTISSQVTPAILAANSSSTNYLAPANGVFPSSSNDFESGDPIVNIGNNTGQCTAPVYVKTVVNADSIDLKYYTFYPWNGFQGFQVGVITNFVTQPYYFNWASFASHYGDWEHVTVRISSDTNTLLGVFYSQHGEAQWVSNPSLDGTHPVVYPGWNSHANYSTSGNNINTTILDSPGIIPVSWLKVVDVTTNTGTFKYYHQPNPFYSNGVQWKPWQNTSQLVLLDNNATASQWLSFMGKWGPTVTNKIEMPPSSLPSGAPDELYTLAEGGSVLGLLNNYIVGGGPYGPQAANWNVSNEGIAGTYEIRSVQTGLGLDGGANQKGTLVQMWSPNSTPDQVWNLQPSGSGTSIVSSQTGLALDGGANSSGTHPQMWTSNGTVDQQWVINPSGAGYSITSVQSGLVLDGGTNIVGANPQMYTGNGTVDQQWILQRP